MDPSATIMDLFDEDDIFKYDCEWMLLDSKKLSASKHPGAAALIFGIHMRRKMFKIFMRINNPESREKQLTQFPWESVKKISISKKKTIHELTMTLNKGKCKHSLCVIASPPEIFEQIYEVLNGVFFYLMNDRFKTNCAQICKNIRTLSALETARGGRRTIPGLEHTNDASLEELIEGMLSSFENRNARKVKPEETGLPGNTVPLQQENNENSIINNMNSTEDNINSNEDNKNLEPDTNLGFDLQDILSVPSIVAIFITLFIHLIYFLFFNPEM